MTDSEVRASANAAAVNTQVGLSFWLDEIRRRDNARTARQEDDPFAVELGGGLLTDHTVTR